MRSTTVKFAVLFSAISWLVFPIVILAEEERLPEPLVGQTTMTQMVGIDEKTYYGAVTGNEAVLNFVPPGKTEEKNLGPSLFLNQTQSNESNGYIALGNYDIGEFSGGMTTSFWLKPSDGQKQSGDWIISIGGPNNKNRFDIQFSPSSKHIMIYNGEGGASGDRIPLSQKLSGVWINVIVSMDQNGLAKAYLDGKYVGSLQAAKPEKIGGNGFIGRPVSGSFSQNANIFYIGGIDEVKIFNSSLSTDQQAYDLYQGKNPFDPVNYWPFTEGVGTTVGDVFGNVNGIILGAHTWSSVDVPIFPGSQSGFSPFGFEELNLMRCVNGLFLGGVPKRCFIKNLQTEAVKIMTSRTYIESTPGLEVASLLYPSNGLIVGDAYVGGHSLKDFNYWGRHLALTDRDADSDETYWGIGGYTMNPEAQASLEGPAYENYKEKLNVLRGEAADIGSITGIATYRLQSPTIGGTANDDAVRHPEGKVWKSQNDIRLTANKYSGTGTIIVGSESDNSTVTIDPASGKLNPLGLEDVLGIIVYGDVVISPNAKVKAAIFATGDIYVGENAELTGSFVAKTFSGLANKNIRFYYDERLGSKMPPGFGYLNMPKPN